MLPMPVTHSLPMSQKSRFLCLCEISYRWAIMIPLQPVNCDNIDFERQRNKRLILKQVYNPFYNPQTTLAPVIYSLY